ncbi:MAG: hypothetical protein AAFY25_08725 [Pseudomonadota bacterium]
MSIRRPFDKNLHALNSGLASKLGLGIRRDATSNLRRARHRLPRHMRAEADKILRADEALTHPKLARIANTGALDGSFKKLNSHLKAIDLADERRGARINLAAGLVFKVLLIVGVCLAVLAWQDLI